MNAVPDFIMNRPWEVIRSSDGELLKQGSRDECEKFISECEDDCILWHDSFDVRVPAHLKYC
jgi:hypothetical protein